MNSGWGTATGHSKDSNLFCILILLKSQNMSSRLHLSHHHCSVVPRGLRKGTAHYETPGHLTSFTARTAKVVIFIWDHKLSKTCFLYILVEYNITQNYQIPGPIQLPSSSRHNCVLNRKMEYEQHLFLQFWRKAHGHLQPLQMCSKWSQEGDNSEQVLGGCLLHPATPREGPWVYIWVDIQLEWLL